MKNIKKLTETRKAIIDNLYNEIKIIKKLKSLKTEFKFRT